MSNKKATKRDALSLAIKGSIRSYYQKNNQLSTRDMIAWAEGKYGIPFLPATMRTILFPKPRKTPSRVGFQFPLKDRKRERPPNWPELEAELATWYASLTQAPKGKDMKEKAIELWQKLAPKHYEDQEQPSFGDNWRDKFKDRNGFKHSKIFVGEDSREIQVLDTHVDLDNILSVNYQASIDELMKINSSVFEIPVMQFQSNALSELNYWENGVPNGASNPSRPMPFNQVQYIAACDNILRSPNAPSPSWARNEPQNCNTGGIPLPRHQKVFPDCSFHKSLLQPQRILEAGGSSNITGDSTRTGNKRKRKDSIENFPRKRRAPNVIDNQNKRSRKYSVGISTMHSSKFLSDPKSRSEIQSAIYNIFRMAKRGDTHVDSIHIQGIVDTLLSALETSKSSELSRISRRGLPKAELGRMESLGITSTKPLLLLKLGDRLRIEDFLSKNRSEIESELLFDAHISLPSPQDDVDEGNDSECIESNGDFPTTAANHGFALKHTEHSAHGIKSRKQTFFSMASRRARLDIHTSTCSTVGQPDAIDYTAQVILTLPGAEVGSAQLRFFLSQRVSSDRSTFLTPTFSIRKTIPKVSKVFGLAYWGTVEELRNLFLSGEASLEDCDEDGRSLINYALLNSNVEVCRYLLQYTRDINSYEVDLIGNLRPLVYFQGIYDRGNYTQSLGRGTQCLKLLLGKGADPTLQFGDSIEGFVDNAFSRALLFGSKNTVEALLSFGYPFIDPNSFGEGLGSPICWLADCYQYEVGWSEKFNMLLKRGADIHSRDRLGRTCLHLLLLHSVSKFNYIESELKSILMAAVSAGADIYAIDGRGETVSDIACRQGHEGVWFQVLEACGYSPWDVFTLENKYLQPYAGMRVYSIAKISPRPSKLHFEEYYKDRERYMSDDSTGGDEALRGRQYWGAIYCDNEGDTESEDWSVEDTDYRAYDFSHGMKLDGDRTGDHYGCFCHADIYEYMPINGDCTWLGYITRHQFLWYWHINYSHQYTPSDGESSSEEGEEGEEGE